MIRREEKRREETRQDIFILISPNSRVSPTWLF
jgi:hypothetical protein